MTIISPSRQKHKIQRMIVYFLSFSRFLISSKIILEVLSDFSATYINIICYYILEKEISNIRIRIKMKSILNNFCDNEKGHPPIE